MCDHGYDAPHRCPWCKHSTPPAHSTTTTGDDYARQFMHLTYQFAHEGKRFTVEDITAEIGVPNESHMNSNNSVGRLMSNAKARFKLDVVDYVQAKNPRSRGRAIPVYQRRRA